MASEPTAGAGLPLIPEVPALDNTFGSVFIGTAIGLVYVFPYPCVRRLGLSEHTVLGYMG